MIRRTFLGHGLMLLGFGRRVWAQLGGALLRYSPLTHPIRIPLDAVTTLWQPVPFKAEAVAPSAATMRKPGQRVLLSGVLLRAAAGDDRPERFSAFCLECPHEQCEIKFITDPQRLTEINERLTHVPGDGPTHPLFFCGCHSSVFNPVEDGINIGGPAHRGLYRFRVSAIRDGGVEINEVEEEALV